ncbi:MAG: MFS transporter DHA1 family bicyclomycin/chloramphenicol resistance protein [Rhodobacteraceae bacterium]|uniref:multidrug effflux MFS transporter n=1 Tax=Cypionkella sp. TaxID=2811411 RepID=UPI001321D6AD|nr:multidrug effflux MFS transporter [Cypionkella sp.]KAF0173775.1 MAG: MFS transporter DHA1 family bicyclomycin/chloramphenicol resistance protein [Paracoccaceae bacterium]MDO8326823.1 multidrug effflux MFS transporter [Cypionkella sp.]
MTKPAADLPKPVFLNRATPPKIVTLTLLAGLSALTMNIFLPSLPGMAAWFDAPYSLMQLSVALYLALSSVLQILIGPISDRYGRRKVILAALILFLIATVGTLLAPNATVFLIFRMAQAVIAAGMVLSRAVVRDMVADDEAASMIGYVTMGMSLVPMIGPVIGGLLDEAFGWQANFGLLLGLGLIVLALTWADLGETATLQRLSFADQLRTYPGLLKSRRFWGYCGAAAFASGCFYAYLGGAPYVGNQVYQLSSSHIGLLFAITAVGYMAGNFIAGRYSVRLGMNKMVLIGTLVTTAGLALLAVVTALGQSSALIFFGLTITMGLGNGIALPSANAGILSVRPELAGTASGLGGAIMIGGGAGLAALAGAILPPGSTEMPLVLLMLASSIASTLCILAVIRRARTLGIGA